MKTRNLILGFVAMSTTVTMQAQQFEANTDETILEWKGAKVSGEHNGYIILKSGEMTLKDNKITDGLFIIDMTSITNEDISAKMYNQKLVDHLKSDDFFSVETYPEAKLVIKESGSFNSGSTEVKGDLTIKGKTHPIAFIAMRDGDKFKATITVDRSKYDVRYGSKTFFADIGDKMIYDEFTIDVNLMVKE